MSEAKHTPGPWSVPHFARPEVNCECRYVLCDSMMGAIASVHCSGDGGWENAGDNPKFDEACANAHLIAAAPTMFDALKAIQKLPVLKHDYGTQNIIKAVIAKAEGRTPCAGK